MISTVYTTKIYAVPMIIDSMVNPLPAANQDTVSRAWAAWRRGQAIAGIQ